MENAFWGDWIWALGGENDAFRGETYALRGDEGTKRIPEQALNLGLLVCQAQGVHLNYVPYTFSV